MRRVRSGSSDATPVPPAQRETLAPFSVAGFTFRNGVVGVSLPVMGMFDTVHLDPPLACPVCGTLHAELRTHLFGDVMESYRIGSVIPMSPVLTGVLREPLWCPACREAGRDEDAMVYLGVFHTVPVAVGADVDPVRRGVAGIDRVDLIGRIERTEGEVKRWRSRHDRLRSDLLRRREEQRRGRDEKTHGERVTLRRLFDLPPEIRDAEDPLGTILDRSHAAKGTEEEH